VENRVDELIDSEQREAAVKIQAIHRGKQANQYTLSHSSQQCDPPQGRAKAEGEIERQLEQELAEKAVKIQSIARGRQGRAKAADKMEQQMENEMEVAAVSVQARPNPAHCVVS
jgi:hypothetical protein